MYSTRTRSAMSAARASKSHPPRSASHVRANLKLWQRQSVSYDRRCAGVLGGRKAMAWGLWRVPESELRALGDPRDRDILEIGCGAARWSIALGRAGARAVGLDLSPAQLTHARRLLRPRDDRVRLVRGNAEELPFDRSSFDVVFCDWGAMTFCDPYRTVPEAARVLRFGGRLVFATSSPFRIVAEQRKSNRMLRRLLYDYFGMHRVAYRDGEVNFVLPYGEWIRLFGEHGLSVERLVETRPKTGARSAYLRPSETEWSRRWPVEAIWHVRKVDTPQVPDRRSRASARSRRRVAGSPPAFRRNRSGGRPTVRPSGRAARGASRARASRRSKVRSGGRATGRG
jgi:ubiquinone/menaquinone biosynthesis C-methylase UbiE